MTPAHPILLSGFVVVATVAFSLSSVAAITVAACGDWRRAFPFVASAATWAMLYALGLRVFQ